MLIRIIGAFYVLVGKAIPVPREYGTIAISEKTMLLTNSEAETSVEVALWALQKNQHYWTFTDLGRQVAQVVDQEMEVRDAETHS